MLAGCTQVTSQSQRINDYIEIQLYNINGSLTNSAFLAIRLSAENNNSYLNVLADINGDGVFTEYDFLNTSQDEWIVKNVKPISRGFVNRFAFQLNDTRISALTMINVKLLLTDNKTSDVNNETLVVNITNTDSTSLLALDVPGTSEDLKRASGNDFHIDRKAETPDLSGGPMDCFAISAANNIISLAKEHEWGADLPSANEMVAELKTDMNWNNGILNSNFMSGKNKFVERHNLPIETEEIKRPTMDDFEEALTRGWALEVSTTMIRSRSGRSNTGHVLTGMGAMNDGEFAGIAVHDPATGEGVDVYDVTESGGENPYLIIKYPLWDGVTFIDTLYVQKWVVNETVSMVTPLIEGVEYVQLHDDSQVFPHKYTLIATITNASNPVFSWETNCGYFIGPTNLSTVEWWYDSWACADSMIVLTVTNDNGLSDVFEYTPFI